MAKNLDSRIYDLKTIMNHNYETIHYEAWGREEVVTELRILSDYLISDFTPWAESLEPAEIATELKKHGLENWVENYWLRFYESKDS